jgi:hypothetical protein
LRIGDILAEPGPLPARLREAQAEGVEIPLFRLEEGRYRPKRIRVAFRPGEEKRLGITGDLGFLVQVVEPGSLAARAELRAGDFIPKINDAFVHSLEDLKLVDRANAKRTQVFISRYALVNGNKLVPELRVPAQLSRVAPGKLGSFCKIAPWPSRTRRQGIQIRNLSYCLT